jgi:drug/metabolite transporter (DMT)-like permease
VIDRTAAPRDNGAMELFVFIAVLGAAVLHAGWNALVRIGLDRFSLVLMLSIGQAVLGALLLFVSPLPAAAALPWLVASAVIHAGYKLFLVQSYRHADLTQAYPLARGTAPLIVAVVSLIALGERLALMEVLAILFISSGILLMAARGSTGADGRGVRMQGRALAFALATAAATASYTLVDGHGARAAGHAGAFVAWMFIGDAVLISLWALATRGPGAFVALRPALGQGALVAAMSFGAYAIVVWAFTRAPIALVAALRETSILFAILIGAFMLGERLTPWRLAAAALIAAGVPLMRL